MQTLITPKSKQQYSKLLATAGFVLLIAVFKLTQPYEFLFFSHEPGLLLLFSLARIVFCIYFFSILFSIGNVLISFFRRRGAEFSLQPMEEIAISVICGSAVLRLAMLFLGFLGLYHWLLLSLIATVLVWLGTPQLAKLLNNARVATWHSWTSPHPDRPALIVASVALLLACGAVVVYKYLLPNGTGDYFSHYLPYYQAVTERGNVWPNEVWYHFFISKGAGDVFFTIILSDLLGPLTVSCAMFFCALILMFCLLRRGSRDDLVATAGTAITAACFIWTVETTIGFRYWAEFSKEHVTTAVLFFGCVWATWLQKMLPANAFRAWAYVTAIAFVGLVLLRVQFAAIALVFLALVSAWEYISGKRKDAMTRIIPAAAVLVAAFVLLTINFAITGLVEVTPFRLFWKYADQEKFSQWVSPFLMLLLEQGSSPDLGSLSLPDLKQFPLLALLLAVFRLDRLAPYLWPFGVPLALVMFLSLIALWKKPDTRKYLFRSYAGICGAMFVSAIMVFFTVNQIGSLFRLYMFMMFPVIALGALPFAISRASMKQKAGTGIGILLAGLAMIATLSEVSKIPQGERRLAGLFLVGKASIADAYSSQNAVWPAALEMAAIVGPKEPIWLSQVGWHFCIAPACNTQSFFSFSMGKNWPIIMFDSPTEAIAALQAEGINYFAIDTASPFFDLLPYSPLFRPEEIKDHLGIAWTDGTVYLLTWRSDRTQPLTPEFLEKYAKCIESAMKFAEFEQLHGRLADAYSNWKNAPRWPVELDQSMPRIRGWQ